MMYSKEFCTFSVLKKVYKTLKRNDSKTGMRSKTENTND